MTRATLAAALAAIALVACDDGPVDDGVPEAPEPAPDAGPTIPPLPSTATCDDIPLGRAYLSVIDEMRRDGDRLDIAVGAERDVPVVNSKWYQFEIEQLLYSAFDSYPHGDLFRPDGVRGTFNGVRPDHTHARVIQGPLTAMKLYEISFQICLLEMDARRSYSLWDSDQYQASPTVENARPFCERILGGALRRTAEQDEVDACVAYATEDVLEDPDPRRQWASVCGAVGASVEVLSR